MTRWEYKAEIVKVEQSTQSVCEKAGLEGWEAWQMDRLGEVRIVYFKRPLE